MKGTVNDNLEAEFPLIVYGPSGIQIEVTGIIDTGFDSWLTLPITAVEYLELIRHSSGRVMFSDGSISRFDYYAADVDCIGSRRTILVSPVGTEVLIGMKLLLDCELRIDVIPGGEVSIALRNPQH